MDLVLFCAVMIGAFFAMTNITFLQFCLVLLIVKFLWMSYGN